MKRIILTFLLGFAVGNINAQAPPPPSPAPDSLMAEYTGKFKFPDGSPVAEITMVMENGVLTAQTAMGNSEFKKTDDKDVFEIVAYGGTAIYKRDKEGKITGLRIQVQDIDMEGAKIEAK